MANGHGGKRKGAGRKSTRDEFVPDGKQTPIEYVLEMMRNDKLPQSMRFEAAKAALPYCSARLAQTDLSVQGDLTVQLVSYLDNDPNPKPSA